MLATEMQMNLAVVMDSRFYQTPEGYITHTNVREVYWREFAKHWDKIYFFVRCFPGETLDYTQDDVIAEPNIHFIPLPAYEGLGGFRRHRKEILSIFAAHLDDIDIVSSRGPGQLSNLAVNFFGGKKTTLATIIGDVGDIFLTEKSVYRNFPFLWPFRKFVAKWMVRRYRKLMTKADCVIGVATHLAEKYRGTPTQPIAQIADTKLRNGDFIAPRERVGPLSGIAAGRIWEYKNYQTIIRAVAKANDAGCDCRFGIAGDGYYRPTLEALAEELGVADRITFHGRIESQKDLWALYEAANFSCLVSHTEGLPLASIEAMATGLPMIIADLPYADDLVTNGKEGFRIAPEDVDALTGHLIAWSEDESLRRTMAENAFAKVQELSITNQVGRFAELAKAIAKSPKQ